MDDVNSRVDLPAPRVHLRSMEVETPRPTHPPRIMILRQEDVVQAGFTNGCPGCLDINARRGGMRVSATHNEECQEEVERTQTFERQAHGNV